MSFLTQFFFELPSVIETCLRDYNFLELCKIYSQAYLLSPEKVKNSVFRINLAGTEVRETSCYWVRICESELESQSIRNLSINMQHYNYNLKYYPHHKQFLNNLVNKVNNLEYLQLRFISASKTCVKSSVCYEFKSKIKHLDLYRTDVSCIAR